MGYSSIPVVNATHRGYIGQGIATGAFLSMASHHLYLPTVYDFVFAGWFAGCYQMLWKPFFRGFSGKVGFCAFCGFCTYSILKYIIMKLFSFVKKNNHQQQRCCICHSRNSSMDVAEDGKENDKNSDDSDRDDDPREMQTLTMIIKKQTHNFFKGKYKQ